MQFNYQYQLFFQHSLLTVLNDNNKLNSELDMTLTKKSKMEMEKRLKADLVKKDFYKHGLKMFNLKYIVLNYILTFKVVYKAVG